MEQLLYGEVTGRIPIHLFTDSESTLESVASSKQVVTKTLRMTIVDLKERLIRGEITSIAWLPTERMWADLLTKEKKLNTHDGQHRAAAGHGYPGQTLFIDLVGPLNGED